MKCVRVVQAFVEDPPKATGEQARIKVEHVAPELVHDQEDYEVRRILGFLIKT